jgi:hypothetical protein
MSTAREWLLLRGKEEEEVVSVQVITVSSAQSCKGKVVKLFSAAAAAGKSFILHYPNCQLSPTSSMSCPCLLFKGCAVGQQGAGHEAWPDSIGQYGSH